MKKIIFAGICSVLSAHSFAGTTPMFLVMPNLAAPSSLISGQLTSAVYQVTNNTETTIRRTFSDIGLALMPAGVTPDVGSVIPNVTDYCSNPFTLAPGASCLLKVDLNGSALPSGVSKGPIVCAYQQYGVGCVQPSPTDQINTTVSQGPIPQSCNANISNFNWELTQPLDSAAQFDPAWGPTRNSLPLSSSTNPNLGACMSTTSPTSAQISWEQQRVLAAAAYWIAQKLNYCHHYNPDWSTPASEQGAAGTAGGYCNPVADIMPGSVYYGQEARWNYNGQGGETQNNWVNNNRMWYGMDCSNYTAFLYNFALGIKMNSKTGLQAGQAVSGQDFLSPNQQNVDDTKYGGENYTGIYLNQFVANDPPAGYLVCADGTIDPNSSAATSGAIPSLCAGHGGYISGIDFKGHETGNVTAAQLATILQPGDLLYIAGGGVNPDGSSSEVTHVVMWTGMQVGYGANQVNPNLIAPDDICSQSDWQPVLGEWVITDSHYQGADYRVITPCFYLNNLWGVRRVIA